MPAASVVTPPDNKRNAVPASIAAGPASLSLSTKRAMAAMGTANPTPIRATAPPIANIPGAPRVPAAPTARTPFAKKNSPAPIPAASPRVIINPAKSIPLTALANVATPCATAKNPTPTKANAAP